MLPLRLLCQASQQDGHVTITGGMALSPIALHNPPCSPHHLAPCSGPATTRLPACGTCTACRAKRWWTGSKSGGCKSSGSCAAAAAAAARHAAAARAATTGTPGTRRTTSLERCSPALLQQVPAVNGRPGWSRLALVYPRATIEAVSSLRVPGWRPVWPAFPGRLSGEHNIETFRMETAELRFERLCSVTSWHA